jgi:hypothetical protein
VLIDAEGEKEGDHADQDSDDLILKHMMTDEAPCTHTADLRRNDGDGGAPICWSSAAYVPEVQLGFSNITLVIEQGRNHYFFAGIRRWRRSILYAVIKNAIQVLGFAEAKARCTRIGVFIDGGHCGKPFDSSSK